MMAASWAETFNVWIIGRDECFWSVNFNTSRKLHSEGEKCKCKFRIQVQQKMRQYKIIDHIFLYPWYNCNLHNGRNTVFRQGPSCSTPKQLKYLYFMASL
jgi:hypothetical protein